MLRTIQQFLLGRPLHNLEMTGEKLPKWKALAIFSSDALSSVGYGPEQIAIILAIPGMMVYGYFSYAFLAVILLLGIVTLSYTQVSRANPGGGGSYSVAKNNLGETFALIAAAALFADYILTVAVSVSSGTDALLSAFLGLWGWEVEIDIFVLFAILTIVNLRGVRESSNIFVFPTYLFVVGMFVLICTGVYQALIGQEPLIARESTIRQEMNFTVVMLILRAFANGCSSMTGVEAISNGVPMFKAPEHVNAIRTTYWMSGILAFMLAGTSFLIMHYHVMPLENVTMLSQIAENALGRGWLYYYIQLTTMLILYLAANTSYNGLPPLLSILARDGYMPRYLASRGSRLSFSNGILLLSVIAALLIVAFMGNVEHLISLYAIGVFLSLTIAQSGLVVHWRRKRGPKWRLRAMLNGVGAVATGLVVLVIGISKFVYGAWIIIIFIPAMIVVFRKIKNHYSDIADQLHLPLEDNTFNVDPKGKHIVIVPVSTPTAVVAQSIRYAKMIGSNIIGLHITSDEETAKRIEDKWNRLAPDIKIITVYSPYRLVIQPIIEYVEALEKTISRDDFITIVIPEFETKKWWHRLLHNQTGLILRTVLIFKKNIAVTTIPYHLLK